MNGVSTATEVVSVMPWWKIALFSIDVVLGVFAVVMIILSVVTSKKIKKLGMVR